MHASVKKEPLQPSTEARKMLPAPGFCLRCKSRPIFPKRPGLGMCEKCGNSVLFFEHEKDEGANA